MDRIKDKYRIRMRFHRIAATAIAMLAVGSSSCFFDTATYLCKSGLRCRAGQICDVAGDACIDIGGCGDGIKSPDTEPDGTPKEVCDDGNTTDGDGCSADCKSNETCGNGIIDRAAGETCDGQSNCSLDCQLQACGNRILDDNEQCDLGPADSPGCNADCTFVMCGDGHANTAAGEECDSRNIITSTCNGPICTKPVCGDNFTNPPAGEDCDAGPLDTAKCNGNKNANGSGNCKFPTCGDSYTNNQFTLPGINKKEECDTGGEDSATCDFDCLKPVCGDHHVNRAAGEQCDDGNQDNSDDCPDGINGSCKAAACGDGFLKTKGQNQEECDDGNHDNTDGCPDGVNGSCKPAVCGDGFVRTHGPNPEGCDDGNHDNSDDCPDGNNGSCQPARCGDGFVNTHGINPEQCDGNECPGHQRCQPDCTCPL